MCCLCLEQSFTVLRFLMLSVFFPQVKSDFGMNQTSLEQYTSGCCINVPDDGMVFMILLSTQVGNRTMFNLLT